MLRCRTFVYGTTTIAHLLQTGRPMFPDKLDRFAPYALAALRIATALVFIPHGTQKLFGFPAPPASGLPPLVSLFGVGATLELVGGILILLGLWTRPVA